jgi:hypothetical protein
MNFPKGADYENSSYSDFCFSIFEVLFMVYALIFESITGLDYLTDGF